MTQLAWEGSFNVRALRPGLVRGDSIGWLTARGWAELEAHGVRTVVDLRNDDERTTDLPRPESVTVVHYPLDGMHDREFWDVWQVRSEFGTPLYYQPHLERFPERSAAVIRAIAHAAPGGVMFNCVGGRDRTGQIAMIVLSLLGVSAEDIGADYCLSYDRITHRHRTRRENDEGQELRAFMTALGTDAPTEIRRILSAVDLEAQLRKGGAEDADFAALRARFGSS